MEDFGAVLEAERAATVERLATLTGEFDRIVAASRGDNADDEHDPEGTTIAFERSQLDAHVRRARAHLDEIDAALERLVDGVYGRCEGCGRSIVEGRLLARPTARACVACASR